MNTPETFPLLVTQAEAALFHALLEAVAPLATAGEGSFVEFADKELGNLETLVEGVITAKFGPMVEAIAKPTLDNFLAQAEAKLKAVLDKGVATLNKDATGSGALSG